MLKKRAAVAAFSFLKKRLRRITLKVTGAFIKESNKTLSLLSFVSKIFVVKFPSDFPA